VKVFVGFVVTVLTYADFLLGQADVQPLAKVTLIPVISVTA
jgi:hypothetical protein